MSKIFDKVYLFAKCYIGNSINLISRSRYIPSSINNKNDKDLTTVSESELSVEEPTQNTSLLEIKCSERSLYAVTPGQALVPQLSFVQDIVPQQYIAEDIVPQQSIAEDKNILDDSRSPILLLSSPEEILKNVNESNPKQPLYKSFVNQINVGQKDRTFIKLRERLMASQSSQLGTCNKLKHLQPSAMPAFYTTDSFTHDKKLTSPIS